MHSTSLLALLLLVCSSHALYFDEAGRLPTSQEFMATKSKEADVIKLKSGIMYKVIQAGDATQDLPTGNNLVNILVKGKLINGLYFERGPKQVKFTDGELVVANRNLLNPALQQIVPMMRPGDSWELYVPAGLGQPPTSKNQIKRGEVQIYSVKVKDIIMSEDDKEKFTVKKRGANWIDKADHFLHEGKKKE
eukprot:gnl/TRDRNA2_/TRDRNA2_182169_c0_seq1.p1 gnl/TRDRNA2_/TRDRNA2_182169_c0~~gnl/TRDRNA2_/TRDRNA2_182169_c0_seq1.p1  ORF type:complete len:192 (-),score=56.74 gnl/TRDRNA2_/TRDRNA2_182169_c0_seq1:52-627(-)